MQEPPSLILSEVFQTSSPKPTSLRQPLTINNFEPISKENENDFFIKHIMPSKEYPKTQSTENWKIPFFTVTGVSVFFGIIIICYIIQQNCIIYQQRAGSNDTIYDEYQDRPIIKKNTG